MKNHLKRISSPRTWKIDRKSNKFTIKPNPGAHSLEMGMSLGVIMRDILNYAQTASEVRKILKNEEVLVDGKRRKDYRYIVGLFDVISFPKIEKNYRFTIDNKGKLNLVTIESQEANLKLASVVGKTKLKSDKMQINLHDGKNIISAEDIKVGDTLLLELPKQTIKKVLKLNEGSTIILIKGKHSGDVGTYKGMEGKEAVYQKGNEEIKTTKKYIFVIGQDKPEIKVN
jgi:small subunit ribosomal protein S4e